MADALDLGSSGQPPCRFKSCYPHPFPLPGGKALPAGDFCAAGLYKLIQTAETVSLLLQHTDHGAQRFGIGLGAGMDQRDHSVMMVKPEFLPYIRCSRLVGRIVIIIRKTPENCGIPHSLCRLHTADAEISLWRPEKIIHFIPRQPFHLPLTVPDLLTYLLRPKLCHAGMRGGMVSHQVSVPFHPLHDAGILRDIWFRYKEESPHLLFFQSVQYFLSKSSLIAAVKGQIHNRIFF